MSTNLNFEYDVRIPAALIKQMMDGEITAAMLLTMNMLYLWSNWNTGKVRRVCAASLWFASGKVFSERTFSEALRKLEWMRWITRHMTPGSTKWYPVIIHNYKWVDDAGKLHILNPKEIEVYDKFPEGRCDEVSDQGSWEGSDETSDEGSDRHESEPESLPKSEHESEAKPKKDFSFSPSFSQGTGVPAAPEEKEKSKPEGLSLSSEEQNQPQEQDPELDALAEELLNTPAFPSVLGLPYFTDAHIPLFRRIAAALRNRNRSAAWFESLVRWAKTNLKDREARFWKQKLQTGDKAVAKLAEFMEKGTIAEQFDVHMVGRGVDFEVYPGEENNLLYRDGKWYSRQRLQRGECDTCGMTQSLCECRVPDPSKPIFETQRGGSYVVGHETKPKFASEPGSMEEVMQQNAAKAAVGAKSSVAPVFEDALKVFGVEEA